MHRAGWPGADEVAATAGGRRRVLRDVSVVLAGDPQGEVRGQDLDAHRGDRGHGHRPAGRAGPGGRWRPRTCRPPAGSAELAFAADDGPLSVSVRSSPTAIAARDRRATRFRCASPVSGDVTTAEDTRHECAGPRGRAVRRLGFLRRQPAPRAVARLRRAPRRRHSRRSDAAAAPSTPLPAPSARPPPSPFGAPAPWAGATNAPLQPSRSGLGTGWKAAALAAAVIVLIGLVLGGRFGRPVRRRPGDAGHLDRPAQAWPGRPAPTWPPTSVRNADLPTGSTSEVGASTPTRQAWATSSWPSARAWRQTPSGSGDSSGAGSRRPLRRLDEVNR